MRADACTQTGRFDEAQTALDEALSLVEKNDERFQEPELHRLKGELLLAESDDQTAAEECFRRAVESADRHQSKAWKLRDTTSLAQLWQKQDRRDEALKAVIASHSMFTALSPMPCLADAPPSSNHLLDH